MDQLLLKLNQKSAKMKISYRINNYYLHIFAHTQFKNFHYMFIVLIIKQKD